MASIMIVFDKVKWDESKGQKRRPNREAAPSPVMLGMAIGLVSESPLVAPVIRAARVEESRRNREAIRNDHGGDESGN